MQLQTQGELNWAFVSTTQIWKLNELKCSLSLTYYIKIKDLSKTSWKH